MGLLTICAVLHHHVEFNEFYILVLIFPKFQNEDMCPCMMKGSIGVNFEVQVHKLETKTRNSLKSNFNFSQTLEIT